MSDFDQRHACGIQAGGHRDHLLQGDLVPLGMHAVSQAHVVQLDPFSFEIHYATSANTGSSFSFPARISFANISAVRAAEAVMMSRLPAYLGK